MRHCVGKTTMNRLEENLDREMRRWLDMADDGTPESEVTAQRWIVRGCAMQVLSWCNPLYHGSRVMVAEVERRFVRRILEEQSTRRIDGTVEQEPSHANVG